MTTTPEFVNLLEGATCASCAHPLVCMVRPQNVGFLEATDIRCTKCNMLYGARSYHEATFLWMGDDRETERYFTSAVQHFFHPDVGLSPERPFRMFGYVPSSLPAPMYVQYPQAMGTWFPIEPEDPGAKPLGHPRREARLQEIRTVFEEVFPGSTALLSEGPGFYGPDPFAVNPSLGLRTRDFHIRIGRRKRVLEILVDAQGPFDSVRHAGLEAMVALGAKEEVTHGLYSPLSAYVHAYTHVQACAFLRVLTPAEPAL